MLKSIMVLIMLIGVCVAQSSQEKLKSEAQKYFAEDLRDRTSQPVPIHTFIVRGVEDNDFSVRVEGNYICPQNNARDDSLCKKSEVKGEK